MNHARLLLLSGLSLLLTGCGYTVESARETGAQKSCDYAVRCQQVGAGAAYTTRDNCVTQMRATFLNSWPDSVCTNATLNAANLDICLKSIDAAACGNILDFLSSLTKCTSAAVCNVHPAGG